MERTHGKIDFVVERTIPGLGMKIAKLHGLFDTLGRDDDVGADQFTVAALLAVLASGAAVAVIYTSWNFMLLLAAFNVAVLAGTWLLCRFFAVKGALRRFYRGEPPARPGRLLPVAGVGSALLCLLALDVLASPLLLM